MLTLIFGLSSCEKEKIEGKIKNDFKLMVGNKYTLIPFHFPDFFCSRPVESLFCLTT